MRIAWVGIFLLLQWWASVGFGQTTGEEKFFVLPLAGYSSQFGFGGGINAAWLNIGGGSTWQASTAAYFGTLYNLDYVAVDLLNRHLFDFLYVDIGGNYYQNNSALFYGFGNDTTLNGQTQFAEVRDYGYAKLGIRFFDNFVIGAGVSQGTVGISQGVAPSTPQFLDQYGSIAYASGLTTTFTQFFLTYDSREPETAPQEGNLLYAMLEQSQPYHNEPLAEQHLEIIGENFLDFTEDKDFLLVSHLKYERTWGDNIPFFTQAPIGGLDTLRGYEVSRFIDVGAATLDLEPRWSFWSPNGSFIKRFELSTAYEVGRVFDANLFPSLTDLHSDVDFGFTVVMSGDLPLRFDYAISPESSLIYLNLFYPF